MKTKLWLRIMATLLSVILFTQFGAIIVFAEEQSEEILQQVDQETLVPSTESVNDNPIVSEVVELRDANTKYFVHKDNKTHTVVKF